MKKKLTSLAMAVLMTVLILLSAPFAPEPRLTQSANAWDGSTASTYCTSGAGTASSPYLIDTPEQLAKLAAVVNAGTSFSGKYFTLNADIALSSDNGYGWTPIGTHENRFKGNFNGNNKTVSGMMVRGLSVNTENLGLFGVCEGASITNLTITNTQIHSNMGYVGALCGNAHGCTIGNITVTGTLHIFSTEDSSASYRFGGLLGRINSPATIWNCKVAPTGTTEDTHTLSAYSYYGGFAGDIRYENSGAVNITDCSVDNLRVISNHSTSNATTYSGGFFGHTDSASVTVNFLRCGVSNSTVSGYYYTGGFGYDLLRNSTMTGCYVTNVTLADLYNGYPNSSVIMQTGGLLGYSNGIVKYSYVSLAAFSAPKQLSASNFLVNGGHRVHSVVGYAGGYSEFNHVYYVNVPLLYGSGSELDVGTAGTYGNGYGRKTVSGEVESGVLGWNLYYPDEGVYWTQKDNEFDRGNTNIIAYPLPTSSASNMIVSVTEYGEDNTLSGSTSHKFSCNLDGVLSSSTNFGSSKSLYYNAGMTVVNSVTANDIYPAAQAYRWYFTRNDPNDRTVILDTYALESKSFTVPAERNVLYCLHGETERVYKLTYTDPNGNTVTPSAGAPTTFTVSNPANIYGVTTDNAYWNVLAWQRQNGLVWDDVVNEITPYTAGYANLTLRAKWTFKTETGADGKEYKLLYSFDHLEMFRDMVNSGTANINGKLSPVSVTYGITTLRTIGTNRLFSSSTKRTDRLSVQTAGNKTAAELYYGIAYLENLGYTVDTPDQYAAVITQLQDTRLGRIQLAQLKTSVAELIDALGLKWGEYNPGQIGTYGAGFRGVFDGNNASISGVTYGGVLSPNSGANACYGLFNATNGAVIKNLTLSGGSLNLTGSSYALSFNVNAAPLVSIANVTTITNCKVSVPVDTTGLTVTTSSSYPSMNIGGIVGSANGTSLTDCTSSGTITLGTLSGSSVSYPLELSVGGFVGKANGAAVNLTRCVRTGAVTSTLVSSDRLSLGGAVGWASTSLNFTDCLVMSDVTADPTSGTAALNPLYISGFAGRAGELQTAPVSFLRCAYGGTISNYFNTCYVGYSAFNGANSSSTLYETWDDCYYDVYKNTDDYRIGSLFTTDGFTGGYVAWQLQQDYMAAGGTDLIWGQAALGSGNPIGSSSASNAIRKVEKYSNSGYYMTRGNSTCDVDGNYTVNTADFIRILNGSVGKSYNDDGVNPDTAGADISGDGVVDALDAMCAELILSGNYVLS